MKISANSATHEPYAIGAFAAPDVIHVASGPPKTRHTKIMHCILRKVASSECEGLGLLRRWPSRTSCSVLSTSPGRGTRGPLADLVGAPGWWGSSPRSWRATSTLVPCVLRGVQSLLYKRRRLEIEPAERVELGQAHVGIGPHTWTIYEPSLLDRACVPHDIRSLPCGFGGCPPVEPDQARRWALGPLRARESPLASTPSACAFASTVVVPKRPRC